MTHPLSVSPYRGFKKKAQAGTVVKSLQFGRKAYTIGEKAFGTADKILNPIMVTNQAVDVGRGLASPGGIQYSTIGDATTLAGSFVPVVGQVLIPLDIAGAVAYGDQAVEIARQAGQEWMTTLPGYSFTIPFFYKTVFGPKVWNPKLVNPPTVDTQLTTTNTAPSQVKDRPGPAPSGTTPQPSNLPGPWSYIASGGLVGGTLGALLSSRENRLRNAILGFGLGGAIGALWPTVWKVIRPALKK